jgi:hypothetical protein
MPTIKTIPMLKIDLPNDKPARLSMPSMIATPTNRLAKLAAVYSRLPMLLMSLIQRGKIAKENRV